MCSIYKKVEKVRKSDMNGIIFKGMGLFDTNSEWIHPEKVEITYEIIYVTHGTIYLFEDDVRYVLNKGDLILLKPSHLHGGYEKSIGRTSFYWLHFSGEIPDCMCGYLQNFSGAGLFRETLHYDNIQNRDLDALRILTEHILLNIKTAHEYTNKNKIAKEVYEWTRINIKAGLTSKQVAENFKYNPEYLSRIIKKEYGVTLKVLIDNLLCDKFENLLLNSTYSVKEISALLEFKGDLTNCINYFKYHKKMSPSQYRKLYSETHMNRK